MDYYSNLGVNKSASQEDIKKAYRKLAMQHHPDRTGGDDTKFKQIQEAYATLSDVNKRAEYDTPAPQFNSGNMNDIFGSMFGGAAGPFGFGRGQHRQTRNQDVTIAVKLSLEDVLTGKQLTTRYQTPSGRIKEADINVPPGVDHGVGIRFEGLGDDSIPQLPPGNLIVRVQLLKHPLWRRDGMDLHMRLTVSVFDCLLGSKVEIQTLEGKYLEMRIPAGSQPTAIFSIPNHGMPDMRTGRRGNVFVKLNVIVPKIDDPSILMDIERIKNAIN